MRYVAYTLLALLAIAGNVRIGLFVLNRSVFGQKTEANTMKWLLILIPPALLLMSGLYYGLFMAMREDQFDTFGYAGAVWLAITATTGAYWLVDRAYQTAHPPVIAGVRTLPSEVIRLRKAHIPSAILRNLGAHNEVYDLEVTRHEVIVPDLPEVFQGYRIAFMTDTHVASFMRRNFYREIVGQSNRFDPDLVLFGGDFVTWNRHIPLMAELLITDLQARDGIYAVLGNHDYWADADSVIAALTARDVRFLVNRSVKIKRGQDAIHVVGIDEIYRGKPDYVAAFGDVDRNRPCIAVSHHPDVVERLGERRVDLLLCGHTHGGQIRAPFFGAIVIPSRHEGRYDEGFFRLQKVLMYVSRGVGSIPPIRILCKPELALFTLVRE
jgi:uncharacterized protein